ncbi:hypothetical protein M409DRAFT_66880 [Zasmidium cellare ATCC 36951]|uniref:Ketoreductase domain-containing protein n=1 Tax=Zasmidium cellare ATCC 36951 TaxID=1080233 RepID=A0A6A6CFL5_ZASCE|nr:uncharacterized protein M409DRAFT_66880 [Zasmidium cellare ATCC 36951]KAF2165935.1 hypothetical protein M409DRAFT_66880 [Zasmidium cellare ATCC 36951]
MLTVPRPVKTYHRSTYDRIALENTGFVGIGKTVLVTGGATGIGFATAKAFAKAGVKRVVLVARSKDTLQRAKDELKSSFPNTETLTYADSVTDHSSMAQIFDELKDIDILLLSAFQTHEQSLPQDVDTSRLQETFATNVMASFELVKLFLNLPAPTSGGQKTVLNVTSAAAQTYIPGAVGYCASKAATIQIMQHFAIAQASKPPHERVRFYSYHPGVVITESYRAYAQASGIDDIEKFNAENGVVHEEIELPADFAVWLAGPQSDFLSGRYVWAEWDVDELVALKERVERESGFLTIGLVL